MNHQMKPDSDYCGMTVNERLVAAGLISDWDNAVQSRNRQRMVELLGKVDLSLQAEKISDAILAHPQFYGF